MRLPPALLPPFFSAKHYPNALRWLPLIVAALVAALPLGAKDKWPDVAPADLAATASKDFPEADLEILFFRQTIDNSGNETWSNNHLRAKIYTAKGVERTAIFAIEHNRAYRATDLEGRVIKPDGTSVELAKSDFHETTAVKKGGTEILRTTFAFPNIQPGDVIEYRWSQGMPTTYGSYHRFFCQAEVPTREYLFNIAGAKADYNVSWFNCQNVERKDRQIVVRNLPPFVAEQFMPAETAFRGWIMIIFDHPFLRYYQNNEAWKEIGEYLAENFRYESAPNQAVRAKAAELIAGASTAEEKLAKLYDFVQGEITNLSWFEDPSTAEAKKKRKKEERVQNAAKTLERKSGLTGDLNRLFAGLVRAAGFEARLTLNADRDEILDIQDSRGWLFADREGVAVKVGEKWTFYTPAQYLVPAGMLSTHDEGAVVYVCDEQKGWFDTTPIGLPEKSQNRRTGKFALDAEGTLTGDVEVQLTGQRAIWSRDNWWDLSKEDIAKRIREDLVARLPTAEVSDASWTNLHDRTKPLILNYKVTVPAYAEAIGSRLAFAPNFFEANATESFTAESRRFPIFFEFAEQEHDEIDLVLPAGFVFDGASAPASVGAAAEPINAQYKIKYASATRTVMYRRDHTLGTGGATKFRAESYGTLRSILGRVHRSDTHQLVLKPAAAPAPKSETAAPSEATESPKAKS